MEARTGPRPTLAANVDVDVCVVGGGLAGLTVARELARRRWSVAVLEARHIDANASAHNCGLVAPGFAEAPETIIERVGMSRARALWAMSLTGADYVRSLANDTGNGQAALAMAPGRLAVSCVQERGAVMRRARRLNEAFGYPAEFWRREQVLEVLRSEQFFDAVYWPDAFSISATDYAQKLARSAETFGVHIYERTPAVSIDASGIRKRIETPSGRVRAAHIVLAAASQLGKLHPMLASTIVPLVQELALTSSIGPHVRDAILFEGAVDNPRRLGERHRLIDGERMLLALPLRLFGRSEARTARHARSFLDRTYRLGNVPVANVWSNPVAFAVHRMPQIGEVSPGLWLASAFATHGLNTTAMAGELIARAITESDDHWRLFSPYGLVWAGGNAGKTAVFFSMAAGRLRDLALEEASRLSAGPGRPALTATAQVEAAAVPEVPVSPASDAQAPSFAEPPAQSDAPPDTPDAPQVGPADASEANSGGPEPPQTGPAPATRRSRRRRRSVARRTERTERAP